MLKRRFDSGGNQNIGTEIGLSGLPVFVISDPQLLLPPPIFVAFLLVAFEAELAYFLLLASVSIFGPFPMPNRFDSIDHSDFQPEEPTKSFCEKIRIQQKINPYSNIRHVQQFICFLF